MKKVFLLAIVGCICLLSVAQATEISSFWTSPEQRSDIDYKWRKAYFKRLDGKIIRYTEATTRGQKPSGRCNYKYLGDGVAYKINGVLQGR